MSQYVIHSLFLCDRGRVSESAVEWVHAGLNKYMNGLIAYVQVIPHSFGRRRPPIL